jgi:hypothetical protein
MILNWQFGRSLFPSGGSHIQRRCSPMPRRRKGYERTRREGHCMMCSTFRVMRPAARSRKAITRQHWFGTQTNTLIRARRCDHRRPNQPQTTLSTTRLMCLALPDLNAGEEGRGAPLQSDWRGLCDTKRPDEEAPLRQRCSERQM